MRCGWRRRFDDTAPSPDNTVSGTKEGRWKNQVASRCKVEATPPRGPQVTETHVERRCTKVGPAFYCGIGCTLHDKESSWRVWSQLLHWGWFCLFRRSTSSGPSVSWRACTWCCVKPGAGFPVREDPMTAGREPDPAGRLSGCLSGSSAAKWDAWPFLWMCCLQREGVKGSYHITNTRGLLYIRQGFRTNNWNLITGQWF